jgi:hypothetical protein
MFLIFFYVCFLFSMFVVYFVYSVFLSCLCIVSPFVYSCLFPIFVQVYRPLPLGGNQTAVNKYRIIYHTYVHWQTCLVCTYTMNRAVNAYWYTRA